MNKAEALEWAADYAERTGLFKPPLNQRGYTESKWTPPTPTDRLRVISELADQVTDQPASSPRTSHGEIDVEWLRDNVYAKLRTIWLETPATFSLKAVIDAMQERFDF